MIPVLTKRILNVTAFTLLMSSAASAKVYLNSMCHMKANSQDKVVQGDDKKDDKFPLASISKVVTTLWAVEKLGPDYRFKTRLHVSATANGAYDIHIEGSRDPIFGRNLSYFLISELNRMKITKIERISFDENFLLAWLAEDKPLIGGTTPRYETIEEQAAVVRQTLMSSFATPINNSDYNQLKAKAARIQVQMQNKPSISVRRAEFIRKSDFQKPQNTVTVVLKSAPLRTILKRMNNQSNNYIADNMYWNLGGTTEFNAFMTEKLQADRDDIVFHNGSGNNEGSQAKPIYNEATCETMIKVLYSLNKSLNAHGYDLSDVMAVAGKDSDSTVGGYGGVMAGSMTAKTGSVNKAKTLTGSISTKSGEIYFAVLMHTDYDQNKSDWGVASQIIKNKVSQLINQNGGPRALAYTELLPLPFDRNSYLEQDSVTPELAQK